MSSLPFRLSLIGREKEKILVDEALANQKQLNVLYFKGWGGIGKTALLQYISEYFSQPRKEFLYSGLIDLYDYDNNSSTDLERVILENLKARLESRSDVPSRIKTAIANYQRRSKEYQERRFALPESGSENKLVEAERQALSRSFQETYREMESHYRVVLCFDTVELLQHEIDGAQRKLGLVNENILLKNWISSVISQMTNSAVFLAGRPETAIEGSLQLEMLIRRSLSRTRNHESPLKVVMLEGLLEENIVEYLERSNSDYFEGSPYPADSQYIKNVRVLTGGKPIMLGWFADLCSQEPWRSLEQIAPEEIEALIPEFEKAIIGEILRGRGLEPGEEEPRKAIEFLSWARKGLRADSLAFLLRRTTQRPERYTLEVCESYLNRLRQLSFVKVRESHQLFFLHDEIYRIMNTHLGPAAGETIYKLLIEFSSQQTRQLAGEAAYYKEGSEWYNNPSNLEHYLKADSLLQKVILERLYYHLCASIRSGYDEYRRLSDLAIMSNNYEADERLRDEFLRFMAERLGQHNDFLAINGISAGMVERDDALQWLKRLGARGRGDSEDASVVQTLLTDPESPFEGINDPLFKADLVLTDWKYAIYKTRDSDSVINNLKEIIATLEGQSNRYVSYELPIFGDYKPVDYVEWRFNVLLGLAYNNLGYTYRVQRWLLQAEEAYRKALPYLNKISLMEVQRADTTNNLAFVYRLLGRLTEARILCDDALRERQRQGHSYAIALSFNTLSLISMGMDQYDWALQHCQNARRLIERALGRLDSRGVGLVYNAMGKILRNYGRRWRNEQTIEEAITYLRSSTRIFDDLGEISNQVEAYNELGCSFRALGIVQEKLGKNGTDSFRQAIEYLNEAISLCGHEMPIEKADCYQDLAECYYRMGSDDTALENLEHADGQIDRKYYIDKLSMQLPNFAEMPQLVPECLAMLGKTELLRGDILFRLYMQTEEFESKSYDSLTLQSAIERYICALGYFESFSASSDTLRSVLARLYYRFVEQIRLRSGIGGWYQIQRDRRLIITQVKYYRELYHLVDSPAVNQLVNLIDF